MFNMKGKYHQVKQNIENCIFIHLADVIQRKTIFNQFTPRLLSNPSEITTEKGINSIIYQLKTSLTIII